MHLEKQKKWDKERAEGRGEKARAQATQYENEDRCSS